MTNKTDFANTPKYILKSEGQPALLTIDPDDPKTSCTCVYGFSDKPTFDQFIKNAKHALTPYPLVQGYLANQIAEAESNGKSGTSLGLVILDATDPKQPVVFATTMATVLDAQRVKANQIRIEMELVFNSKTGGYLKPDSKRTPVTPT